MFEARLQTFDDNSERAHSAGRLAALRTELKRRGLDGFIVPRADCHQNEYVPPAEERLAWLTGFTGSAGAVILWSNPWHSLRPDQRRHKQQLGRSWNVMRKLTVD